MTVGVHIPFPELVSVLRLEACTCSSWCSARSVPSCDVASSAAAVAAMTACSMCHAAPHGLSADGVRMLWQAALYCSLLTTRVCSVAGRPCRLERSLALAILESGNV